jgi:hypothetical protein
VETSGQIFRHGFTKVDLPEKDKAGNPIGIPALSKKHFL